MSGTLIIFAYSVTVLGSVMALDHSSPGMFCAVLLNCSHCAFRSLLSHSETSEATYVGSVAWLNVVGTFEKWSIKQISQHWPTLL